MVTMTGAILAIWMIFGEKMGGRSAKIEAINGFELLDLFGCLK